MSRYVKIFAWYWFFYCIFAGAAIGYHKAKCPDSPESSVWDVVGAGFILPALIGFAMTAPSPPYTCR